MYFKKLSDNLCISKNKSSQKKLSKTKQKTSPIIYVLQKIELFIQVLYCIFIFNSRCLF